MISKSETASKAAELEKRSIASTSNYKELEKQMQEMQVKMRELYRTPFEKNREINEEERLDIEIQMLEAKRSKLKKKLILKTNHFQLILFFLCAVLPGISFQLTKLP